MHILHLIDAKSPQACPTTQALLAATTDVGNKAGHRHTVGLLGGETLQRDARRAGIENPWCVPVIRGSAVAGMLTVPRRMRTLGAVDLIHCWSLGALTLAATRFGSIPRLLTLTQPITKRAAHWLSLVTRHAGARTITLPTSNIIRRQVLTHGVGEDCVHVIRPAIVMGKVQTADRQMLRDRWGVKDDNHRVIALLSDPPGQCDAHVAALAAGSAAESANEHITGLTLLVHPSQINRQSAQKNMGSVGRNLHMVAEPDLATPWQVLPGTDAALMYGDNAGHLSMLWAMAAGTPIIGQATYSISEIVAHNHSALLATTANTPDLAQRIEQCFSDSHLAWQMRDTARHEAFSYFSPRNYRDGLKQVYQQLVDDKPIEVPPLEITGGLRFSGSA